MDIGSPIASAAMAKDCDTGLFFLPQSFRIGRDDRAASRKGQPVNRKSSRFTAAIKISSNYDRVTAIMLTAVPESGVTDNVSLLSRSETSVWARGYGQGESYTGNG